VRTRLTIKLLADLALPAMGIAGPHCPTETSQTPRPRTFWRSN